ncbi:MAG: DegT/DnrJ/EryC1/StrS aminotransferase family protein [Bacteroidetes bacterium]|nr:DegT/DnrJ/EryC1/StrS aminotransferase family protein [Bacteroidota bacterium]
MKIPLIKPFITDDLKNSVLKVLDSGYLTEGPVTHEFENSFKEFIGSNYAIAVTSCTTGLEVALRCLNIGPGDEVIVPDYTYPATAQVVAIVGATAVIVDVHADSMLIDYNAIEAAISKKTKAVIPVSIFGNPLDYDHLKRIKEKYNVFIIEDAACSIGASFKGKNVGVWADISVFSLHPRKFITTGEGGMITTENDAWAEWMNSYKHFGMNMKNSNRESIRFDMIGTNYKLSNILSAVGLAQMKHIDELLDNRITLANNYKNLLAQVEGIQIPATHPEAIHSYQSFCIFIDNRDQVMTRMRENGVEVQIGTYSLHKHTAFQNNPLVRLDGMMRNSSVVFDHCLTLPLYYGLSIVEQKYIVDLLNQTMNDHT